MNTHSPTPFYISKNETKRRGLDILSDSHSTHICSVPLNEFVDNSMRRANAAFIVRACNSHDALLAALQTIADFPITDVSNMDAYNVREIARTAISQALGHEPQTKEPL
jgi:hypothetical protein